jgi:hypothetical protein
LGSWQRAAVSVGTSWPRALVRRAAEDHLADLGDGKANCNLPAVENDRLADSIA